MNRFLLTDAVSLPTLGWFSFTTLLVAGFSLSAGVTHFLDWLYQKRENDSLAFSVICFTVAGHAITLVFLTRSPTVAAYVFALKVDVSLMCIAQPAFAWLVSSHMRVRMQRLGLAVVGLHVVLFVANLQSPASLLASQVVWLLVRTLPGGEAYVSAILLNSQWRYGCFTAWLLTDAYCLFLVWRGWRNVARREAFAMVVSLLCMLTTWLQTTMLETHLTSVLLVGHYAFLGFVLLMGSVLAARYGRQSRALAAANEVLRVGEERFRMLVETAPDAIVVYDAEKDLLVDANSNARHLFGLDSDDQLTAKFRAVAAMPAPPDQSIRALARRARAGEVHDLELDLHNALGDGVVCAVRLARLPSAGRPLVRISFLDITKRKEYELRQLEYQEQLRSIASELTLTEERERKRIAAYLHDQVAQQLLAAQLRVGEAASCCSEVEAGPRLLEVRSMLNRAIQDTYSLTFELSLPILHELGLVPAMEWLGEELCERNGIRFLLIDRGDPKPLDHEVLGVCFSAVRELLRNVIKHARASEVRVTAYTEGNRLWVVVEDNGVGFAAGAMDGSPRRGGGFGLFSVRERLEYLAGTMQIESIAGRGTTVTISAPLGEAESLMESA